MGFGDLGDLHQSAALQADVLLQVREKLSTILAKLFPEPNHQ